MDDFEGCKISVDEKTADVAELARELELEVKSEDVTELLQSHDKNLLGEELFLKDGQRKLFLEMDSPAGEDTVKIVGMTTKELEYYINLVDKVVADFERTDSNSERISTVGKMQSPEKLFVKDRVNQWGKICIVVLF